MRIWCCGRLFSGFLVLAAILLSGSADLHAQRTSFGVTATEIRVEGSQRIEPDTVRSYVPMRVGDRITVQALDEALKKLYATGLFADVVVRQEGTAVVIRIVENPVINRIEFEGNKRLENDVLRQEVKLKPRVVYTRPRVQSDVQRIIDLYRRSGRFAASVEPKVIQLPQNRVDLVFEIDEGKTTGIRNISFVGNKIYDDSDLREVIRTKESAWYRFLSSDDNYDPDRLSFDRELLRRFYLSKGYADFRVLSAVAELAPDRSGFFVTFTIEEGPRYKFGKIDVESSIKNLEGKTLKNVVVVAEGDTYNADKVEASVISLTNAVGDRGFAFVDIRPRVKRHRDKRTIDVSFVVREGPKVFVERINIDGNLRTIDPVIRREVPLVEGDAFNASKLRRARKNIRGLGFFKRVDVKNVPGSAPDKTVVNVKVEEQSTGEISLGAGLSSTIGPLADIGIRERNLLGKGQDLQLKFQISANSSEIDLKFTEPYFLDRKLSAGFDIFRTTRDLSDESSFERKSLGAALRTGFKYSDTMSQQLRYRFSRDEVTDVDASAALAVQEQEGISTISSISQTLRYDTRDDRLSPREGQLATYTTEVAGLGGSEKFVRNSVTGTQFFGITDRVVASVKVGGGILTTLGDKARIIDRFFLGGRSLRGFAPFGVGPRDLGTNDAVGGEWFYSSSFQLTFPLGLPNELGVKGRAFTDLGSTGKTDTTLGNIADTGSLRASAGVGISWNSPFGPFTIDMSLPYLKENFDEKELFRFDFGTRF